MNYARALQCAPTLPGVIRFPISHRCYHVEMYGSNSLHPVLHAPFRYNATVFILQGVIP